jgi:hypothetical protein
VDTLYLTGSSSVDQGLAAQLPSSGGNAHPSRLGVGGTLFKEGPTYPGTRNYPRSPGKDGAWITFWCRHRDQVLAAFAQRPVKVDLEPRRFSSLYPEGQDERITLGRALPARATAPVRAASRVGIDRVARPGPFRQQREDAEYRARTRRSGRVKRLDYCGIPPAD